MKRKITVAAAALLGVLLPATSLFSAAIAQSPGRLESTNTYASRIGFVPPINDRAPRRTHSGASRRLLPAQCGGLALLPESGLGLTASEQLSLYVYFAEGTVVDEAILSLKSVDESEYFEANLDLPREKLAEQGGVMEVAFPEALPALTAGEEYTWSLVLKCNGQLRPDSPVLGGAVEWVEPMNANVQSDTPLAVQAQAYGEAGLWYDLLDTLALMRAADPANAQIVGHWSDVLQSVGLGTIADVPLIES